MRLGIIGTGYVGLVTGVCLAETGHKVTCFDIDESKISLLKVGVSPIFEPGLEEVIKRNIENERLEFSTDLKNNINKCDLIFLALGTPQSHNGEASLDQIFKAAESIAESLTHELLIVVKSTVPVGTGDKIEEYINSKLSSLDKDFKVSVASNPEFLAEGQAVRDFLKPDRIIIGTNHDKDYDILAKVYRSFALSDPGKIIRMDRRSSELTKYASNALLATKISFMNELSHVAEKESANIDLVRIGMGLDPRIGNKFLYAGPGYGGSCFPKDVRALIKTAEKNGIELGVLTAVEQANEMQISFLYNKILQAFGDLKGKKLSMWGLAFKPGTDDVRDSPSLKLANKLLDSGAHIVGHDPKAARNFSELIDNKNFSLSDSTYLSLKDSSGLILMTEWPEYRCPNWNKVRSELKESFVFDFRNQWDQEELTAHEFKYFGIGKS